MKLIITVLILGLASLTDRSWVAVFVTAAIITYVWTLLDSTEEENDHDQ